MNVDYRGGNMFLKLHFLLLLVIVHKFSCAVQQKLLLTVYYESQCPDSKDFILKQLQPALHLLHQYLTLKLVPFGKSKLLLTVYYESQCPDSKTFILKQLQPALHLLHQYLTLKLVPFGKSKSINYGDDGFECQHGSTECMGNMVQDCSLHYLKAQSDKKKLAYVACEMEIEAGANGQFDCIEKAKLSSEAIEKCVTLGEGTVLQLESEYYTSLVNPKFVPTVTINGVFDQEIQDYAQEDLIGTLCSILTLTPPCARHYNHLALQNLMNTYVN